ncbi:MAG: putative lipid II flippase FtsW [Desulfovibrionaceae bacterium]|nr:putative lipid II flippase FtsW [Desulfovibrionaceae bacterium]
MMGTGQNSKGQIDWLLLATVMLLVCLGLTMVLSSSGVVAAKKYGDQYYFFKRQLAFAGVGIVAMTIAYKLPKHLLYSLKYPLLLGVIGTLAATLIIGPSFNGAKRWISFGLFTVQPLEFAKIILVIYLAYFMGSKRELMRTFSRGIIPPFAVTGLLCGLLLLQPDFGGAAILIFLLFFMCLVGGCRLIYLIISAGLAAGGAALLIWKEPYRLKRLLSFMNPEADPLNTGYQVLQSLYAIGSGGVTGVGLGASKQKLLFLPESYTDFIMSIMGEELGFVGMSLFFFLFGMFLWRAFLVAYRQDEMTDRLAAFGLTLILAISAMLNLAVVMGAAPPKGVPMPFISYGGSSFVATLICAGLLLNYSRTAVKRS